MRVRKGFFLFPVLYLICGYTMYLHYLYDIGSPVNLSIFSQADMQLLLSAPNCYNMFLMFPFLVGIVFLMREYHNEMQVLRYQNKKYILKMQLLKGGCWSILLCTVGIMVTWIYGAMHGKTGMNWMSANSYYCVMTKQVLEHGSLLFVIFLNAIILFARNFVFLFILLDCWWSGKNIIYGILVSVGICFLEAGDARIPLILRTISVDYPFWREPSGWVVSFIVAAGVNGLLLARILYWVKRKEF